MGCGSGGATYLPPTRNCTLASMRATLAVMLAIAARVGAAVLCSACATSCCTAASVAERCGAKTDVDAVCVVLVALERTSFVSGCAVAAVAAEVL